MVHRFEKHAVKINEVRRDVKAADLPTALTEDRDTTHKPFKQNHVYLGPAALLDKNLPGRDHTRFTDQRGEDASVVGGSALQAVEHDSQKIAH